MKHRILSLLLALLLLLLTACGTGTPQENGGQVAMGRYLEEELTLPEGVEYITMLEQDASGALVLIGVNRSGEHSSWDLYRSQDGGRSWEKQNPDWWDEIAETGIQAATLAPDGSLLLMVEHYSAEAQEIIDAIVAASEEPELEEEEEVRRTPERGDDDDRPVFFDPSEPLEWPSPECLLYRADASGLTQLEGTVPVGEYGNSADHIRAAVSGDVVAGYYFDFQQVSPSGTPIETIELDTMVYPGIFKILDDTLVYLEGDTIVLHDLVSGARTQEISGPANPVPFDLTGSMIAYSHSQRAVAVDPEGMVFYLCDSGGIYRTLMDGSTNERLMDGDLSSLGMPTVAVLDLFPRDDGSFLVLTWTESDNYTLLRYHFDAETPTVPGSELRVYSLQDNPTVRQAIGMYQRVNPNVKVTYQVGMTGEDGMTAADAMRSLSTELLAGSGPDLLVVDGMPVEGYIRQGLLLDLSAPLSELLASGDLLDNVLDTWCMQDGLWAIPARFSVPMINAEDEAMKKIRSLEDLADWVEDAETQLVFTHGKLLLEEFYPLCTPLWFDSEGALDKDAMALSLQSINRMVQRGGYMDQRPVEESSLHGLVFGAVSWSADNIPVNFGTLYDLADVKAPEAAIEKRGEGDLAVLENGRGGVLIPSTSLGVNATGKTDLALDFLEYLLSPDVLQYNFADGLPASREALRRNTISPYDETQSSYYSVGLSDSVYAELQASWASEAFLQKTLAQVTSVKTASPVNLVIRDMVADEAIPYFQGDRTLEDAVNGFAQKYSLYLAEQN